MPFYEYQCKHCGHTLEAMQKINDAPLRKCPHCGKSQLTRLMSAPVFRLKGGGWYETDFKGDADNKKNLADRPEAATTKDEAKPDGDGKAADAKNGDTKGADKGADAKGAEAKESKPADKAAAGSKDKPAAKTASAEPSRNHARPGISKRGAAAPRGAASGAAAPRARPKPSKAPARSSGKAGPKSKRRG